MTNEVSKYSLDFGGVGAAAAADIRFPLVAMGQRQLGLLSSLFKLSLLGAAGKIKEKKQHAGHEKRENRSSSAS